jgi:hypothetical protein
VITIKSDQHNALACENAALTYTGRFSAKGSKEQATKVAKTHGGITRSKSRTPKPPTSGTPRPLLAKKATYVASGTNQPLTDQQADDKKKGVTDKEVPADPSNPNKKLHISTDMEAK